MYQRWNLALPLRRAAFTKNVNGVRRVRLGQLGMPMCPSLLLLVFVTVGVVLGQQRPPVILIDGYHLLCKSENLTSSHDFGELEQRLQSEGVKVSFFGTCSFNGKPSIEDLANTLGTTIRNLNVPQVDLVSHSMGGLIVRAYLSGKQNTPGVFTPPPDTHVRKWVSIATSNFGALLPGIITGYVPDQQTQELVPGNQFLFDLATWNQNHDDLRGVDTVGIIGNAGGFWPFDGQNDGTVAVTSASMSFALPDERTRVLPYCHGAGDLTSILGLGCNAPPLAKIQSDNPLSWSIIDSFLKGAADWESVGHSPSQDRILSQYGGVLRQARNDLDQPTGPIQDQTFVANAPRIGGYSIVIDKSGPRIASITPSQSTSPEFSLTPGMRISIHGYNLEASTVTVNGQILALNGSGSNQLNAVLPGNVTGLAKLTVRNSQGSQTVNVFVVPIPGLTFAGSVSHLAVAGTWDTIFYLVGTGQTSAQVRFSQFGDNGNPLSTTLNFPQQTGSSGSLASSIDRSISPNSLLIVDSTGLDSQPVQTGSARLAAAGQVDGFAIFRAKASGQEAAVPLETRNASSYLLAFDNTGGVATGVAMDNISAQAANVAVILRDDAGSQIGSDSIPLAGNGHSAFVLASQYPVTANKRGAMEIFTPMGGQVSVLGIRFTPRGTMTTIPALANVTATGGSMTHMASGGGWNTTIMLINAGTGAAQAHLRIFDDSGNPLALPLRFPQGGNTSGSSLDRTLAGKQVLVVESTGPISSPLQTGSVQFTTDGSVSGFSILRYEPSGQEALVPLESRRASAYVLAFDNTGGIATGVAVSSVSSQPLTVPVVIRDDTGAQIGTGSIPMAANSHSAFMLASQFPVTAGIRGTMEFDTPLGGLVSALGIRASSTHTFTTLPTLVK